MLRPIQAGDVDAWYAYLSDPAVVAHTSWNLRDRDELATLVDESLSDVPGSPVRFAIVDAADGTFAGSIGFPTLSWTFHTAEVAYDLKPSAHGRGIATACCRAVAEWALHGHDFVRVQATALDTNAASIRVLEKAGFAYEGTLRNLKLVRGVPRDFLMFARTRTP